MRLIIAPAARCAALRRFVFVFIVSCLLAACSGSGGDGSGASAEAPTDDSPAQPDPTSPSDPEGEAPRLVTPDVLFTAGAGVDRLSLRWRASVTDRPVRYTLHASPIEEFVPNEETQVASVTDTVEATIDGLERATRYYLKVVARTESGQTATSSESVAGFTLTGDPVLREGEVVVDQASFELPPATIGDNALVFDGGARPEALAPGMILTGRAASGQSYFRRVQSVATVDGDLVVGTSQPTLSDVFERLNVAVGFSFDTDTTAQSSDVAEATLRIDGDRSIFLPSDDQSGRLIAGRAGVSCSFDTDGASYGNSAEGIASSDTAIEFTPTGVFNFDLDGLRVTGTTGVEGAISLSNTTLISFAAQGEYAREFDLCSIQIPVKFFVGAVPVYIEIEGGIGLSLQGSANAAASLSSRSSLALRFNALANLDTGGAGVSYDGGIRLDRSEFRPEVDLEADFRSSANVAVVPRFSVKPYGFIAAEIAATPTLSLDAAAARTDNAPPQQSVANLVQLERFRIGAATDCRIDLSLDFFGPFDRNIAGSNNICPFQRRLFSLPQVSLTGSEGADSDGIARVSARIQNGTRNEFDTGSLNFQIDPEAGFQRNGNQIAFQPTPGVRYTVYASGNGVLGPLGRRFFPPESVFVPRDSMEDPMPPRDSMDDTLPPRDSMNDPMPPPRDSMNDPMPTPGDSMDDPWQPRDSINDPMRPGDSMTSRLDWPSAG